jgi:hypothetical protein
MTKMKSALSLVLLSAAAIHFAAAANTTVPIPNPDAVPEAGPGAGCKRAPLRSQSSSCSRQCVWTLSSVT